MKDSIKNITRLLLIVSLMVATDGVCASLEDQVLASPFEIEALQQHQIKEVREVFTAIWADFLEAKLPAARLENMLDQASFFQDLQNIQSSYFANKGTYLVLLDDKKVIGMIGVKRLNDRICEGKNLSILKEYRKLGLASKLGQEAVKFAKKQGYKKMRLEVWVPDKQQTALAIYKKWGFYEIEPYQKSAARIFMEKVL